MKILLHICCAPCLIYPWEQLRKNGHQAEGLFFNPNIHPFAEYQARRSAVEGLVEEAGAQVSYRAYAPAEFFRAVNLQEEAPARCAICWHLRLKKTAQTAKVAGFDAFTTTLLVSPYQDQELLKAIGQKAAQAEGVEFYYEDFRSGFRQAHAQARAKGIYCQKYCGCLYSEIDRFKNRYKKRIADSV